MGRFAPTPSGDLHLGSLYAAAASYLDARCHRGRWLVRIEDLDRPREAPGAADRIIDTLSRFGFEWDGSITRQSASLSRYDDRLHQLQSQGLTFQCSCSRLQLEDETRYPGTCRAQRPPVSMATAVRLRVNPARITFTDRVQGTFRQEVSDAVGDVILKRRDQVIAYLLAVVVDDAEQGVTHVVRGADLLDNTPRQLYLQRVLNFAAPCYAHVPVLTEPDGTKLAKSRRSVRLRDDSPLPQLVAVFSLLGLQPPSVVEFGAIWQAWDWAIAAWSINYVPKRLNLRLTV